jgi:hypothetical protein
MRAFIVAALALSASVAFAQRPSTLDMSCQQAQSLVGRSGAVVLSTGRHTYDRFVASDRFCLPGEYALAATAPTQDARQCPLGYTCTSQPPFWDDDGFGMFGR